MTYTGNDLQDHEDGQLFAGHTGYSDQLCSDYCSTKDVMTPPVSQGALSHYRQGKEIRQTSHAGLLCSNRTVFGYSYVLMTQ